MKQLQESFYFHKLKCISSFFPFWGGCGVWLGLHMAILRSIPSSELRANLSLTMLKAWQVVLIESGPPACIACVQPFEPHFCATCLAHLEKLSIILPDTWRSLGATKSPWDTKPTILWPIFPEFWDKDGEVVWFMLKASLAKGSSVYTEQLWCQQNICLTDEPLFSSSLGHAGTCIVGLQACSLGYLIVPQGPLFGKMSSLLDYIKGPLFSVIFCAYVKNFSNLFTQYLFKRLQCGALKLERID